MRTAARFRFDLGLDDLGSPSSDRCDSADLRSVCRSLFGLVPREFGFSQFRKCGHVWLLVRGPQRRCPHATRRRLAAPATWSRCDTATYGPRQPPRLRVRPVRGLRPALRFRGEHDWKRIAKAPEGPCRTHQGVEELGSTFPTFCDGVRRVHAWSPLLPFGFAIPGLALSRQDDGKRGAGAGHRGGLDDAKR